MTEQKIILSLITPLLASMSDDAILEIMRVCRKEFDEVISKYTYAEGTIDFTEEVLKDR